MAGQEVHLAQLALPVSVALLALAAPAESLAQVFEVGASGTLRAVSEAPPPAPAPARAGRPPALAAAVRSAAARYDLAPELIDAVARQESGYDPAAISPKGAAGVMQLMPATAKALGVAAGDPIANIYGGAAYLRQLIDQFDGRLDLALAAYNAGPGAVARHAGVPPYRETQAYVAKALTRLARTSAGVVGQLPQPGDRR